MSTTERYIDLTQEEREERAKLTPKEQEAVDAFIGAAKALPKTLCVFVSNMKDDFVHLKVHKRITAGLAMEVATLRKQSLVF